MQVAVLFLALLVAASCETMDMKWRWWKVSLTVETVHAMSAKR